MSENDGICQHSWDTVLVEFWAGGDTITRSDLMFEGAWGVGSPLEKKTPDKNIFLDRDA